MIIDFRAGSTADETVLEDLGNWLINEFELRGSIRRAAARPLPGEMGAVSDVLSVTLAGGGAVSVLAASLRVWFAQPRRSDVRLKIIAPGGEVIEVDAKRVNDVEALLKAVLARQPAARLPAEDDDGAAAPT